MAKIIYFSIDFDGCFSQETSAVALGEGWENSKSKEDAKAAYISANRVIIEQFREKKGDQRVLLVGSNRQTPYIDLKNGGGGPSIVHQTGSVFPVMEAITEELGENTTFNSFLLSDLEADEVEAGQTHRKFKERGYLNDNGSYKSEIRGDDFKRDGFPDYSDDESKVSLLVAQMKLAAMANPSDEIEFNFYDDRVDIVKGLQNFFTANPELIPKNVSLNISGYSGPELTQEQAQENLPVFILYTTNELEKLGKADTELNQQTSKALSDAEANNFPVIFKDSEKNEFKIYRRNNDGKWGFEDFDGVIPGLESPTEFTDLFLNGPGDSRLQYATKAPLITNALKKLHYPPIPTTRSPNNYDYGEPTPIVTIKGEGSIPSEISDWKPLYQALRQSSKQTGEGISNHLSVAKNFSLPAFIAQCYSDPTTPTPLEIQNFISLKLAKMSLADSASLLIDSKISPQAIEKILENSQNKNEIMKQVIKQQETALRGQLEPEQRIQLEASLLELYKLTINSANQSLLAQEIPQSDNLRNARNALCASIEEAIKSPELSLDDCQNISSLINHANVAINQQAPINDQFNAICALSDLSDSFGAKKSQNLRTLAITSGLFAVVAAVIAIVLAPTGIGAIIAGAIAGALITTAIGAGIASKVTESDLSKKTNDFKNALGELRKEDVAGEGENLGQQSSHQEFH